MTLKRVKPRPQAVKLQVTNLWIDGNYHRGVYAVCSETGIRGKVHTMAEGELAILSLSDELTRRWQQAVDESGNVS